MFAILFNLALFTFYVGVQFINYLADALGIIGTWWALLLVPIFFLAILAIETFFLLGIRQISRQELNI